MEWFRLHAAEFLSDQAMSLSDAQLALLVKLWSYNCKDGYIPATPSGIAALPHVRGGTSYIRKQMPWIRKFFSPNVDGTRLYSVRMQAQIDAYDAFLEQQRKNARKRWNGDATALPPDSHGNANKKEETDKKEKKEVGDACATHPGAGLNGAGVCWDCYREKAKAKAAGAR